MGKQTDTSGGTGLLLNLSQASEMIGVSKDTFRTRDRDGHVPASVTLGPREYWRREELTAWLAAGCPPRSEWKWDGGVK